MTPLGKRVEREEEEFSTDSTSFNFILQSRDSKKSIIKLVNFSSWFLPLDFLIISENFSSILSNVILGFMPLMEQKSIQILLLDYLTA